MNEVDPIAAAARTLFQEAVRATGGQVPSFPTEVPPITQAPIPKLSQVRTIESHAAPALPESQHSEGVSAFARKVREVGTENSWKNFPTAAQGAVAKIAPTGSPLNVDTIRNDFPILAQKVHGKPLIWFDNAATTQKPWPVIREISRFYAEDNSNIHRGAHTLAARATDAYEKARENVRLFLGARSVDEIIFTRGTTEAINLVAQTFGREFIGPGDEILLTTLEHHANIVPWQMIAKERGATIRVVPVNDRGEIILPAYEALLTPRTKLVGLTHASNSLGTVLPIHEMTALARRQGARVLIDGAQTVAHVPIDVKTIGCDFFVFSGHKIYGPTGIGALYVREELAHHLPPWQGGGNMIRDVTFEHTVYAEPPARFEAGTPNIADAVGLGVALDYVRKIGIPAIAAYEHDLLEHATRRLRSIAGVRILGEASIKTAVISFIINNCTTEEVGKALDREGIAVRSGHHCAQPSLRRFGVESTVRPSFAFYNTHAEIDQFAKVVETIARKAVSFNVT